MTQEALKRVAEKLRQTGASLPAPEVTGTIEGSVVTGLCIALALVESEIEALAQPEQEPMALDLSQVNRLTHFKTNGIIDAHNYNITGFVLTNGDGKKCISDMAAVRWFDNKDFFGMMHNEPAYPPQRTEQEPQDWKTPPKEDAPLVKWAKEQTTPPQRTWVGLTDEEKNDCLVSADPCEALAEPEARQLIEDVEQALKEKNT